jgi:hypothetical protein
LAKLQSILLGDNPFFGVDHLSQERAREKASRSQDFKNAVEVMKYCFDSGAKGMVVSTHPKLRELIGLARAEPGLLDRISLFPILPYVQGYVLKINEKGMINTLTDILNQATFQDKLKIITKGGIGILKKDFYTIFRLFIDIELLQLQGTKIKAVFLHDVLADLALSLRMKGVFETFQNYLHDHYKIEAGLVTKNYPLLVSSLKEWDLKYPHIMTSFNKFGFQMNPSRQECERALGLYDGNTIAMSVLAGGFVKPFEANEYLKSLPKINTAVVGMSSVEHARIALETFLERSTKQVTSGTHG